MTPGNVVPPPLPREALHHEMREADVPIGL